MARSFLFLILCILAGASNAETFSSHPKINPQLGKSFDARNPTDDKSASGCFEWSSVQRSTAAQSKSIEIESGEVTSRRKLLDQLGISSSISARLALASASASLKIERDVYFDSESAVYSIHGRQVFSKESISGTPNLTAIGRAALDKARTVGNLKPFTDACGTDLITWVERGVDIAVIHTYSTTSSEASSRMRASLSAKYSAVSGRVTIDSLSQEISSTVSANFSAFQTGGSQDTATILNLISSDPYNLTSVKQKIEEVAKSIDRNHSPIITFGTASIQKIPEILAVFPNPENDESGLVDAELTKLQGIVLATEQQEERLSDIRSKGGLKPEAPAAIDELITKLNIIKSTALNAAYKCVKAIFLVDCQNDAKYPATLEPSKFIETFVTPFGWMWDVSLIAHNKTDFTATTTSWPMVRFLHTDQIASVTFYKGTRQIGRITDMRLLANNLPPYSLRALISDASSERVWCFEADGGCKRTLIERVKGRQIETFNSGTTVELTLKDGRSQKIIMPRLTIN